MRQATLNDLLKEQWLRDRNNGNLVWITKEGKTIPIKEMTDEHLRNTINHLIRKEELEDLL